MTPHCITLTLETKLELSLEAPCISPSTFLNKNLSEIKKLPVFYGKQKQTLGDFFSIVGNTSNTIENMVINVKGELERVKT